MNHPLARLLLLAVGTIGCSAGTGSEEQALPLEAITCDERDAFETPAIQRLVGPLPGFVPRAIVADDDGIWFTESQGVSVNRLSEDGSLQRLDAPFPSEWIFDAAVGADENVWFDVVTGLLVPHIGRITPDGATTLFPIPSGKRARHVTRGPNDAIWFTAGENIGHVSVEGAIAELPVGAETGDITSGPHDIVWFTEPGANRIGRLSPDGTLSHYDVPTGDSGLGSIVRGPDGQIWFAETNAGKIGRITRDGRISEFDVVTPPARLGEITAGADGRLWFNVDTFDYHHTRVGSLSTCGAPAFVELPRVVNPVDFEPPIEQPAVPYGIAGGDDEVWVTAGLEPFETGVVFRLVLGDSGD